MDRKRGRVFVGLLTLGFIFTASSIESAQIKGERKQSSIVRSASVGGIEPLRVINGQMRGRTISGQCILRSRPADFSFLLTKAEIVGDKLELIGLFRLGPGVSGESNVRARIAGIMSKAANPWPSASDDVRKPKPKPDEKQQQQGREAKNLEAAGQLGQLAQSTQDTARKTPPAPGQRTEQTQSLYAQAEIETACGVLFMSLDVTQRLRAAMGAGPRPVQLGVVPAPIDNSLGEEITDNICAIVRISGDKSNAGRLAKVSELNRLLASSR